MLRVCTVSFGNHRLELFKSSNLSVQYVFSDALTSLFFEFPSYFEDYFKRID